MWGDNAGTSIGVKGTSTGGDGVLGYSSASDHAGVAAVNDNDGFGVWAMGAPAGHFQGTGPGAVGVDAQGGGLGGVGVVGRAGPGIAADGVQGWGTGSNSGVAGFGGADQGQGAGTGVFGIGGAPNGAGVRGIGAGGPNTSPPNAVGVYGQGGPDAPGVFGLGGSGGESGVGVMGISSFGPNTPVVGPGTSGVYGQGWWGVVGVAPPGGQAGVVGEAFDGLAGLFTGDVQIDGKLDIGDNVFVGLDLDVPGVLTVGVEVSAPFVDVSGNQLVHGNQTVLGLKSAAVPFPDGTWRRLYCMESPENWFEDFGTAQLVKGQAQVQLDPGFASVVAADDYHVFLTEYDDNNGLYVTGRTSTGFGVRAKTSPNASGTFSYRVVAKRKDIAAPRFDQVTLPQRRAADRATRRAPAAARRSAPPHPTP